VRIWKRRPFVIQYFCYRRRFVTETFCYRRRFVKETFCYRRRFVRRRFVEETFCKETLCMCVENFQLFPGPSVLILSLMGVWKILVLKKYTEHFYNLLHSISAQQDSREVYLRSRRCHGFRGCGTVFCSAGLYRRPGRSGSAFGAVKLQQSALLYRKNF
jgi:hypothetical protein